MFQRPKFQHPMFHRPKFHRPKFQRPKKYLQTKQTYLMLRISKIHLKMKLRKRPQPVLIYQNTNGRAQTKEKEPQKDLNVVWSIFHERITSIFFSCCCFVGVYISNFNGRACAQFRQTQFRKSSSKFIFQYFHYFFIMPPTPKSAKMSGWVLGGTTFEIRHLYLCTKKFGASNLSQFWRLKALFIIILALNALFIYQFWRRRRFVCQFWRRRRFVLYF